MSPLAYFLIGFGTCFVLMSISAKYLAKFYVKKELKRIDESLKKWTEDTGKISKTVENFKKMQKNSSEGGKG